MDDIIAQLAHPNGLVFARDARTVGCYDTLRRRVDAGLLVRVRRGVFIDRRDWDALAPDARYRARIHAVAALTETPLVFSHWSAAAIWHLPNAGEWPTEVDCLRSERSGGRGRPGIRTHAGLERAAYSAVDGLLVTDPADTVCALAGVASFPTAIAFADAALHATHGAGLLTEAALHEAVATRHGRAGVRAAAEVAAFADGLSESVGESVSRANMHLAGIAIPELQTTFHDDEGFIGRSDFSWRGRRLVGEFDGAAKYVRHEYTGGRDAATIVLREKRREDRLRAIGERVARWGWAEGISPVKLRQRLLAAGAPERRAPAFISL